MSRFQLCDSPAGARRVGRVAVTLVALTIGLALAAPAANSAISDYQYISPLPGSRLVSPQNNIAVRFGEDLDAGSPSRSLLEVTGSISGAHLGDWRLSDDRRTLVFKPDHPFLPGETVAVRLSGAATTARGAALPPLLFAFEVSPGSPRPLRPQPLDDELPAGATRPLAPEPIRTAMEQSTASLACDTLPSYCIPATVMSSNNPDPGCIFLTPDVVGDNFNGRLLIVDNYGQTLLSDWFNQPTYDLKVQPNGRLTFFYNAQFVVMDSTYGAVDSWQCGNGYTADLHECVLLPNGHALLLAYDYQTIDMSQIVVGGDPTATVVGLILQELDASKNVVFQWRSWDHYQITDMIEVPGRSLTGSFIDYVHGNAIEPTADGNLLLSARHMDEITKIDRNSGAIIWRMGLNAKNNQFTFVNDSRGYSHQHDIRELPNGDLTVFDNGNFMTPAYSRGVEYSVDEVNKIATEVWEYRHSPDQNASATGSNRRRANGSKMIGWGLSVPDPKVTDLHADDSIALELGLGSSSYFSYRAFRYPWRTTQFLPSPTSLNFGSVQVGVADTVALALHNNLGTDIPLTCFVTSDPAYSVAETPPVMLYAGSDVTVHVVFTPQAAGAIPGRLYLRSVQESQTQLTHCVTLVAQEVDLTGLASVAGADGAPAVRDLWLTAQPNPARESHVIRFNLPRSAPATLSIFDVDGRHVATPFAGTAHAGITQLTWGAQANSHALPGGVYFAVLKTTAGTRTIKLVQLDR